MLAAMTIDRERLVSRALSRVAAAIVPVILVCGPAAHAAVSACKAKLDTKTGAVEVSASDVTGAPSWGPSADSTPFAFFDVGACQDGDTLKDCTLAEPTSNAARTAPAGCAVYVGDESGDPPCVAYIKKGCAVLAGGADGPIVITQERALIGGVTVGDAPGFPVTISQPGSYRLATDLDVRGEPSPENVTAIDITSDDVAVDLNGFAILGPRLTGTVTGTGDGVQGNGKYRLVVRNGRISGMGDAGVDIFGSSYQGPQIVDIVAGRNGGTGIHAGSGALVAGCTAVNNGSGGIGIDIGLVRDSVAQHNGSNGITASWATISNCATYNNGGDGIRVTNSTVTGCTSRGNHGDGIDGSGVGPNLITGNTAAGNLSDELRMHATDGYSNNVLGSAGISGGVAIGDNLCAGVVCP